MLFGFDQLDELAFLATVDSKKYPINDYVFANVGTIVEFDWLRAGGLKLPSLDEFKESRRLELFKSLSSSNHLAEFKDDSALSCLLRCYWSAAEDEPDEYYYFCQAIQRSAQNAGLPSQNAKELVAAVRELVANVFDHSDAAQSGLVGFSLVGRTLEIVVADKGVGVLSSLRMSAEFSHLRDSGEALDIALVDGASRYGAASGHGGGFRSLFRGLLNLSSELRFRSGDHSLDIKGISPTSRSGRIGKKAELQGFVVSISCRF
jgi:hypothetical protein